MTTARLAAEAHYRAIAELPAGDEQRERMRTLAEYDLYYLLTVILRRPDARNDWIYDRCREVEKEPNGCLDLWAREHYKSTIITFALIIQDILKNPEITIGIFSFNRPAAKAFLVQIMREFERNELLKALFPEILWEDPRNQAPKWSEDGGLVVNRRGNPKEATVEAWGVVEGQPTGRHFDLRVYDDIVTLESVTTPEMINKTTEAWELSDNLAGGLRLVRYVGTRYSYGDTYQTMMDRGVAKPRIHPAVDDDGNPVLMSPEVLEAKRINQGPTVFSAQMLLRPTADSTIGFKEEWLQYYDRHIEPPAWELSRYIVVDPANSKKKTSDWTTMWVIGCGQDGNYHVCEMVRDRLSLFERVRKLIHLHKKWKPNAIGYERYGMQADIEAIYAEQAKLHYRFGVTELAGKLAKADRIARLLPVFEQRRIWLPRSVNRTLYDGTTIDLISYFVNHEYLTYPAVRYDDMMDSLSRILDPELGVTFPEASWQDDGYEQAAHAVDRRSGWMAA